jgi:hypothetical protein
MSSRSSFRGAVAVRACLVDHRSQVRRTARLTAAA